jgi:hypothetical protein
VIPRWLKLTILATAIFLIVARPGTAADLGGDLVQAVFAGMNNFGTFLANMADNLPS